MEKSNNMKRLLLLILILLVLLSFNKSKKSFKMHLSAQYRNGEIAKNCAIAMMRKKKSLIACEDQYFYYNFSCF